MPGKLIENAKFSTLITSERITTTGTTLWNGSTATNTGLDTRDYDECVIHLNVGTLSAGSYAAAVYESATNNADVATAVTDADFTTITTATDDDEQVGSVVCKGTKRYLWVRTVSNSSAGNFDIGAVAVLYKADKSPTDNSDVFDV
jgi:hypothetical protein